MTKRRYICTGLHGVTSQGTAGFILTVVGNRSLTRPDKYHTEHLWSFCSLPDIIVIKHGVVTRSDHVTHMGKYEMDTVLAKKFKLPTVCDFACALTDESLLKR